VEDVGGGGVGGKGVDVRDFGGTVQDGEGDGGEVVPGVRGEVGDGAEGGEEGWCCEWHGDGVGVVEDMVRLWF